MKTFIISNFLNHAAGPKQHYSLVGSGIEAFLPGEAVHATDDPGVFLRPLLVTDLSPLASIFHLQKALSDGDPFPVGVSGPDPHIFHLHCQTLRNSTGNVSSPHAILQVMYR